MRGQRGMVELSRPDSGIKVDQEIFARLLQMAYDRMPGALLMTAATSTILVLVLLPVLSFNNLSLWLALILLISMGRFITLRFYRAERNRNQNPSFWHKTYMSGVLASACAWGLSVFLFLPELDTNRAIFLTFVISVLAAGSSSALAHFKLAALAWQLITLLPVAYIFATGGADMAIPMTGAVLLYLMMLVVTTFHNHNSIEQNIEMEVKNQVLDKTIEFSENRYQLLLATASDAFFLFNERGLLYEFNDQAIKTLGYGPGEMAGKNVYELLNKSELEKLSKTIEQLEPGETVKLETELVSKTGEILPVEAGLGVIQIAGEKLFSVFTRDITERKQYEKELIDAREAAEQASKAKTGFFSSMSHELRTPLHAILGFAQLLKKQVDDDKAKAGINEIEKAGQQLLAMISDMLDMSKLDSDKVIVSPANHLLKDILGSCLQKIQPLADANNITLESEKLSHAGQMVLADKDMLQQILLNLLSNAIQYNSEDGRIMVFVEKNHDRVRICVNDTGPGLTHEEKENLYDPYQQLDQHSSLDSRALSMLLCRKMAATMNADIGFDSEPGLGSSFWVIVPAG